MGIRNPQLRGTDESALARRLLLISGEEDDALVQNDAHERRSDAFFRALKPKDKPYKESFGRGGYMLVMPNGSKYWRLKYRLAGKEQSPYAIGVYPEVSLAEARRERDQARLWIRKGA